MTPTIFRATRLVLAFAIALAPRVGASQEPGDSSSGRAYAWVAATEDEAVPRDAVRGAGESSRTPYWVCRAGYEGGVHPGKVLGGKCSIGYGGKEVVLSRYEVLTGARNGWWGPPEGRGDGAFEAGFEKGRPLVLCRGEYRGELNPGKVVSGVCNFGWGGREVSVARFEVFHLTRSRWAYTPEPPDPEPSAPFTVCADQRVPRGLVILTASRDMKCPNWSATDYNVYTVKRPGETEVICANSPVPNGYAVVSEGLSWNCPGWTATGKNTKTIRRY